MYVRSVLVLAALTLHACVPPEPSARKSQCAEPPQTTSVQLTSVPTYETDIAPIVQGKCGTCHAPPKNQKPILDSYAALKTNYLAVANSVASRKMPPPSAPQLSLTEAAKIQAWAQGGFLEKAGSNPINQVTYYGQIKALLDVKCVSCHSGVEGGSKPELSTYTSARAAAAASYKAIVAKTMPRGGPALTATETALFKAWIDMGLVEGVVDDGTSSSSSSSSGGDNPTPDAGKNSPSDSSDASRGC